tara:strand:- start:12659 stop:13528 length:870 start_codon:yes stop_codon:yes gene_type:complete
MGFSNTTSFDPVLGALEESGYLIEFVHLASQKTAVFPAWITDFSDSFNSDWSSEKVFGRNDPIGSFAGTTRTINLALKIPSYSLREARENMHQLEHLVANMYPSYEVDGKDTHTMSSYPLIKVKFANLIKNANFRVNKLNAFKAGLACWMNSVSFTPDLEAGFHHPPGGAVLHSSPSNIYKDYNGNFGNNKNAPNKSHTFIPKAFDFQCSLQVVHEHKLGWKDHKWLGGRGSSDEENTAYPYGIEQLTGKVHFVEDGDDSPMLRVKTNLPDNQSTKELMKKYNKILGNV